MCAMLTAVMVVSGVPGDSEPGCSENCSATQDGATALPSYGLPLTSNNWNTLLPVLFCHHNSDLFSVMDGAADDDGAGYMPTAAPKIAGPPVATAFSQARNAASAASNARIRSRELPAIRSSCVVIEN